MWWKNNTNKKKKHHFKNCCLCTSFIFTLILLHQIFKLVFIRMYPYNFDTLNIAFKSSRVAVHKRWEKDAMTYVSSNIDLVPPVDTESLMKKDNSTFVNDRILCAVFLQAIESSLKLLLSNVESLKGSCAWAVIAFNGDPVLFERYRKLINSTRGVQLSLYKFAIPRNELLIRTLGEKAYEFLNQPLRFNNNSYPKSAMYLELKPLLSQHEYIWLLDDDLDLTHFALKRLVKSARCAFYPQIPQVVQPLVKQQAPAFQIQQPNYSRFMLRSYPVSPPKYTYLQWESWQIAEAEDLIAVRTDFIEVQAPLLRTPFFDWYLGKVVQPTLAASNVLGADYGFDNVMCTAAAVYSKVVNPTKRSKSFNALSSHPVTCAIILSGSPVLHRNGRSSGAGLRPDDRRSLDLRSVRIMRQAFPTWFIDGHDPAFNPLLNETRYKRSVRLNQYCVKNS